VALRGRVTVDVQTFHAPRSRFRFRVISSPLRSRPLCYYASISDGTSGERRFTAEEGAVRGRSVSRLNLLIAITAAIIGLIYGYDLGSIASALLFLVPAFDLSTFMTSVVTSAVVLRSRSSHT
jgi:hypothetical protein